MRITWTPIYPGADLERAMLSGVEVGRVKFGFEPGWICHLPNANGNAAHHWRRSKNQLTARNELLGHVADWLRAAGLQHLTEEPTT